MGSHMQKCPMINFYALNPHRKCTRQTQENLGRRACMLFTAVSRPSSQWFCLVQPPKYSYLKSVSKHEWKRSSHTQSVSVFSNSIPLNPRFLFPLGARHFLQYPMDTFLLSLGRSLNVTFLVTPVYLHRGAPFLSLGRSLNGTCHMLWDFIFCVRLSELDKKWKVFSTQQELIKPVSWIDKTGPAEPDRTERPI